jgi:hypothetical protein
MKRYLVIGAMLAMLTMPVMVGAEESTWIPPELNWSPTPPASGLVDASGMTALLANLANRGVITPQEQAQLMQPLVGKASEQTETRFVDNGDE